MGNVTEELALAKHMPESFKLACPICCTQWQRSVTDRKIQISCKPCRTVPVERGDAAVWDAVSGAYVADEEWAWRKLWRAFVFEYGLLFAVWKTSQGSNHTGGNHAHRA